MMERQLSESKAVMYEKAKVAQRTRRFALGHGCLLVCRPMVDD
jgi:hypothetical protein